MFLLKGCLCSLRAMYGYELLMNVYSLFIPSNVSVSNGIGTMSIEYRFNGLLRSETQQYWNIYK